MILICWILIIAAIIATAAIVVVMIREVTCKQYRNVPSLIMTALACLISGGSAYITILTLTARGYGLLDF